MSREKMIAEAEKSLGVGEPNGIQTWYRRRNGKGFAGNFPWCDAAITYWAAHAGEHKAVCFGTDYALTTAHAHRFFLAGQWHTDIGGIRRGDIVFFDWSGSNVIARIDHVGLVTGVSDGRVYTIEGNFSDVCGRHVRRATTIVGYGRPEYTRQAPGTEPRVSLADVIAAAKHDPTAPQGAVIHRTPVMRVERALVAEGLLAARWVDGSFGTRTIDAYRRWQRSQAGGGFEGTDADGIPGKESLTRLGNRHGFVVV